MKATELAKAFNEIDDAYLAELETSEKERITMKNRKATTPWRRPWRMQASG